MILEVVLREMESASTAEEVIDLLKALPPGMDRPDPTSWCFKPVDAAKPC